VGRALATNWNETDWSQIDYEWAAGANWESPTSIVCQCRIHNNAAMADGSARQMAGYRVGWPAILAAPPGLYATPGATARFDVVVAPNASSPLTYQWRSEMLYYVTNVVFITDPDDPDAGHWNTNVVARFKSTALEGETNASLVIANAQTNHSGFYSVMVSNAMGAAASSGSRLVIDSSVSFMATNTHWSAVHCVNNLKQIALFARMQANDQNDVMPASFAGMTNWLGLPVFGWPLVLYCRADTARSVPADWSAVDFANVSYEMLPPNSEPSAPFCRCKVHGFYARVSGDVEFRPRIERIRILSNTTTELNLATFRGQSNWLERSTNLIHWDIVTAAEPVAGTVLLYDTDTSPIRFYRIRTE
jgi:hypothetical protein